MQPVRPSVPGEAASSLTLLLSRDGSQRCDIRKWGFNTGFTSFISLHNAPYTEHCGPRKTFPSPLDSTPTPIPPLTITLPSPFPKVPLQMFICRGELGTFECQAILRCFAVLQYNPVTKKAKTLNLCQNIP